MRRHARVPLAAALLSLAAPAAEATLIDSFETGGFSLSLSVPSSESSTQFPDPAHCIAPQRKATLYNTLGGTVTSQLVPFQNVDDAVITTFPGEGGGHITLDWTGGPWDLTDGGTSNRLTVSITGGGPGTELNVLLRDSNDDFDIKTAVVSGTGVYKFSLDSFFAVDPTQIVQIAVAVFGGPGQTVGIRNVETSSGSTVTVIYLAHEPRIFTWQCGPRGGGPAIGWDWAIGWPGEPPLAGPVLQIPGISGAGCQGVELEVQDSGGGGYGEVGLVTVDWQAASFDNGIFELRFVTDPNAGYPAQILGDPVVVSFPSGFRIAHDIHVEDVFGIPDGVLRQELVVSAVPGQEIYLDYVEALPLGGPTEAGYSLSFGYTGAVFDPGLPLLEIYTTASFADDGGVTGVEVAEVKDPAPALRALPSVTRTGTRFVLAGEPRGSVEVSIFDVTGRLVRRLQARGGEATWDAADSRGVRAPAGVYFGRVTGRAPGVARVVVLR